MKEKPVIDCIKTVLKQPMTIQEIADAINEQGLYKRKLNSNDISREVNRPAAKLIFKFGGGKVQINYD